MLHSKCVKTCYFDKSCRRMGQCPANSGGRERWRKPSVCVAWRRAHSRPHDPSLPTAYILYLLTPHWRKEEFQQVLIRLNPFFCFGLRKHVSTNIGRSFRDRGAPGVRWSEIPLANPQFPPPHDHRLTRSVWSAAARDPRRIGISPVVEMNRRVTQGNPDSPGGLAGAALVCLAPDAGR